LEQLAEARRHYGLGAMMRLLASRAAKKLLRLEISEMVWLDAGNLPPPSEADSEFDFRFLTIDEVAELANDPTFELSPEFISRAAIGDDLCFAAVHHDGRMAHYGWYALGSVEGCHHMGVPLSFPDDVGYMYNAFTHPDFRGRRLHSAAMTLALRELAARGITKLLSTIEWTNFASLRSFQRLGFENLGRQWTLGRSDCRWSVSPKGALSRGVCFGSDAKVRQRSGSEIAATC
jgi:ribosomal protein S18 acetylase RimI-like enzyme